MIKNKNGVSVLSIIIAVAVMLILLGTITFNTVQSLNTQKIDNLYNDLRILREKVETYYLQNNLLPVSDKYEDISIPSEYINVNDGETYYKLNLNELSNINLSTEINDESFFIINEQSHTIYYPKGVKVNGITYYTLPEEYSLVN